MTLALSFPPTLPSGASFGSEESTDLLRPVSGLADGVDIAESPPRLDFMYYPDQDRDARPDGVWSAWGNGCLADGRYYSAIGDHKGPRGTVLLTEYDDQTHELRTLVNLSDFLEGVGAIPPGMDYAPAKIDGRIDVGADGWLYYSTYMGGTESTEGTDDDHGYLGDWILRTRPRTGETEVVEAFPIAKHTLPMSLLDQSRMMFYGCSQPGRDSDRQAPLFYAYDLRARELRHTAQGGPERSAAFSSSSGRVYWDGRKYDPELNEVVPCASVPYLPYVRAATRETAEGTIYGTTGRERVGVGDIWSFDVRTEVFTALGSAFVANATYITSMDVDPTGRYLYYSPGAHGAAAIEGTPIVQFDVQTRRRKVIAFLDSVCATRFGYHPDGTYSLVLDPSGSRIFTTWNGRREGTDDWDVAALTVIHIPASERL